MPKVYACVGALLWETIQAELANTGFELVVFEGDLPAFDTGDEPALVVIVPVRQTNFSYRNARLLILARHSEATLVQHADQSELCGDCSSHEVLAHGLRAALHGLVVRSPCRPPLSRAAIALGKLTPREREIVSMLLRGISPKEIARQLSIARSTVRFHLEQARERMGAESLLQMISIVVGFEPGSPR
jgi:DNA-binding CsgD family transcriptional regulator